MEPQTLEVIRKYRHRIGYYLHVIENDKDRIKIEAIAVKYRNWAVDCASCIDCKQSIARKGVVCETHYHDYSDCGRDHCLTCFISRVLGEHPWQ